MEKEQKDPEVPVFTITPEDGTGKSKRVHKNNIMKCNDILPQTTDEPNKTSEKPKRKRAIFAK